MKLISPSKYVPKTITKAKLSDQQSLTKSNEKVNLSKNFQNKYSKTSINFEMQQLKLFLYFFCL